MPPRYCQSCGTEVPDNITDTCPKCEKQVGVPPDKKKSPTNAAALSLVIPGLGQSYCGELFKGISILFVFTLCLVLTAIFRIEIALYLLIIIWLVGIVDAYRTAVRMNTGVIPARQSRMLPILAVVVGILIVIGAGVALLFIMLDAVNSVFPATSCAPGVGCYGPLNGEPTCTSAHECLYDGIARLKVSYYGDAGKFFNKALTYDSQNATAFTLMGVLAYKQGNQTGAIALFDRSLAVDPNQSAVWNNIGVVSARMGYNDKAGTAFRNAVNINRNESVAWDNLGTWFSTNGDETAAVEALDQAIVHSPKNVGLLLKKGRMLNAMGNYSGAADAFVTVIKSNPNYRTEFDAYQGEGEALAGLGRYNESCTAFDAVFAGTSGDTRLVNIWSDKCNFTTRTCEPVTYYKVSSEYYLERLASYNDDLKKNPGDLYALLNKAETLTELKQYDEAIAIFNSVNKIGNGSAEALNGKGVAEFYKGDYNAAIDSFSLANVKDPSFLPSWNNRAFVQWWVGQDAYAVDAYRHAAQIGSPELPGKDNYSLIAAYSGRSL